jgi:hypothetical protein
MPHKGSGQVVLMICWYLMRRDGSVSCGEVYDGYLDYSTIKVKVCVAFAFPAVAATTS